MPTFIRPSKNNSPVKVALTSGIDVILDATSVLAKPLHDPCWTKTGKHGLCWTNNAKHGLCWDAQGITSPSLLIVDEIDLPNIDLPTIGRGYTLQSKTPTLTWRTRQTPTVEWP